MDVKIIEELVPSPYKGTNYKWYTVTYQGELEQYLRKNYKRNIDFHHIRSLKGVWFDVPEHVLTILLLKSQAK